MEERNENMEINNNETELTNYEVGETSGGRLGSILVGLGVVACAGIGALVYKNKGKLEEKRIEKLRKKGYVIYREDEVEVVSADVEDMEEEFFDEEDPE